MKNKPIGEIVLSEPDDVGYRSASVVCLHEQADWDNFPDGTKLYLTPPKHPREKPGKQQIIDGLMVAEGSLREQAMVWGVRKEEDLEKLMQMAYTMISNARKYLED